MFAMPGVSITPSQIAYNLVDQIQGSISSAYNSGVILASEKINNLIKFESSFIPKHANTQLVVYESHIAKHIPMCPGPLNDSYVEQPGFFDSAVSFASQAFEDAGTFVADNKEAFLGAAAVVGTATIAKGIFDVVRNPQARMRGIVEIATGATAVLGSAAGFYAIKA